MKISVAQIRSIPGDVEANIKKHLKYCELASEYDAELIIFPELSLTAFEPELAENLATTIDDKRFEVFQQLADRKQMRIGLGMPLRQPKGITISMLIFQPNTGRQVYSKRYLHLDEEPFFCRGSVGPFLEINGKKIALAICYEISVSEHAEAAAQAKSDMYVASVAKSANGLTAASDRLSELASQHGMMTMMANAIGPNDDFISAGKSAVWNELGECIGSLNENEEGIIILDSLTQRLLIKQLVC